jgi:ribosome biogenesis GTPase A
MNEKMTVQWFPGHMAKTRRLIKESLSMVDAVCELVDARIPESSRNPELDEIVGSKPRIVLLNKCDLADPNATARKIKELAEKGVTALPVDCRSGKGLNKFIPAVKQVLAELIQKYESKGMKGRVLHLMVVGIPNVGKSSFINRLAGQKKAKVEDRPGVTRTKQWVKLSEDIELLDMPGVLWPKFEDMSVGEKLAFTGDTLFKGSIGRTDLFGGDIRVLTETLNKLKKLPPETVIYCGHGESSDISYELKYNFYLI